MPANQQGKKMESNKENLTRLKKYDSTKGNDKGH